MPALKVNIIIVHPKGVVFPRALFRLINANISVNEQPEWIPLGTPAVAILYILTSCTRFRSWTFSRYRKRFGAQDRCSPGHQEKTDDR